ncbi:MAG: MBOAT family protein [Anaerolineae bacterium]|nr:MBOAT family protein [Anaerolineae bacterium]
MIHRLRNLDENSLALILITGLVLVLSLVGGLFNVTASPPPSLLDVGIALIGTGAVLVTLAPLVTDRQRSITILILLVIVVFVVLKSEPLAVGFSAWLRSRTGRPLYLASVTDVQWLGFSYVAFRLIHTLRDRQTGKLPALSLREYMTYLIFFPAYTAGPIDRAERFVKDYRALSTGAVLTPSRTVEGVSRIFIGVFKKFVIADSLARFALSVQLAHDAQTAVGMWILLYAYAIRLWLDFSGYSDIAIGLGRLFGINLPENFDRPYLKSNITTFWQSWHMTLSAWARFYVFTPLSRYLMGQPRKPSAAMVVLITQVATMVVIGLWHGVTLNFVIWGVWHGIGLWVHKLYTDRTRVFYQELKDKPPIYQRALSIGATLLTFHFVALGWVWFALPDVATSLYVLRRLFGG